MYIRVLTPRCTAHFIMKVITKEYHCSAVSRRGVCGAVVVDGASAVFVGLCSVFFNEV